MRLAAATGIAQGALAKLKPVIYNATAIRMEEGKEARDDAALRNAMLKITATRGATAGITHLTHSKMQTTTDKMRHLQGLELQNKAVKSMGGAQCGELSEYVFHQCYEEELFPVHAILAEKVLLLGNPDDNHAYVAIGLENPGTHSDMATWPEDVVICDPWVMYLIRGTAQASASNPGAYTVPQYMNLVKPYFKRKGRVRILYGHEAALSVSIKPVIGGARVQAGTVQYRKGFEFGRDFKRGAYTAAASQTQWWNRLIAAKTRPVAYKLVGLPDPPNFDDDNQMESWLQFEAGCAAGYAQS
jgi:hypothetical protein